jgi:hypothetical protein
MKKIILLATFVFAVFVTFAQDKNETATVSKKVNGPQISFETTLHDYGDIMLNSDGSFDFNFTNTGNEPLILSKPRSSCGCTIPSWPKEPILPGESNVIKVTYNTKKAGPFNKTVTVYSNAKGNSSVVLRIKGKVLTKPAEAMPVKESNVGTAPVKK